MNENRFLGEMLARQEAAEPNPAATDRPSGLAYAGFTLSIVGFLLPGVGIVSLVLSGVALHLDGRNGRRRWAAGWGLGLSVFSILGYLGAVMSAA